MALSAGRNQQAFFPSNAELAAFLLQTNSIQWDAYHACASYLSPIRSAANVQAVSSFWLDVDAGDGKPYADQRAAIAAVYQFAAKTGIPMPLLVGSGYGVHAYWPIEETLSATEWKAHALSLKAACQTHGLHAGPERTADVASILRPPGTTNFKRGSFATVHMVGEPVIYSAAALLPVIGGGTPIIQMTPVAQPRETTLAGALANVHSEVPANPDAIAEGCAQMRAMRDTGGRMPEPLWHACIGVLPYCDEGEEVAHEWSQGDERYSEAETQRKYDLATRNSGPTTCARFSELNPAGCMGCPHAGRIASPVQLGRGVAALPQAQPVAFNEVLPVLPAPFSWGVGNSVVLMKENKNGEQTPETVCRYPTYVAGVDAGELKTEDCHYTFRCLMPQDGWKQFNITAREFWGNAGMAAVSGKGILSENSELFRKFVRDSVHDYNSKKKMGVMFEQCGWKENNTAFLVGNRLYRANGVELVRGTNEVMYRASKLVPNPAGSLEGWKNCADMLFGIGREAQAFALLASLGAPLIRFLASDEGGAIVSLVSRKSGKGKSTAMAGCTTVWGSPDGVQLVNADTTVSKGITFGVMGNLPVVFDELASRDPEIARDFVEVFTNGRDKMRGTTSGEINHVLARWQTLLITASNVSLCEVVKAAGGSDAVTYRVLELPLPELPPHVHVDGDAIRDGLFNNRGHAGDFFIRYLVRDDVLQWAKNHVLATQQSLIREHGFRPEHRFWVRTLACCTTAGVLAEHLGLVKFPVAHVIGWALEYCKVQAKQQLEAQENDDTALGMLTAFMNERISEMLVMPAAFKPNSMAQLPKVKPAHRLSMRYNIDPGQLFVIDRDLRTYLASREFGMNEFCAELERSGILVARRRSINLGAGTDYASGAIHCLEFNMRHPALSLAVQTVRELSKENAHAV